MKNKTLAAAAAAVVLFLGCSENFGSFVNAQSLSEEEKYANAPAPVLASGTRPEDYSTEPVPFQTEIDEFYRQVKEMPIPDEYMGVYNDYTSQGYSVRKLEIDGIPLYEVKKDDGKLKPLVIQIHGGGWHKDLYTPTEMATENVCVVSIDCAGSGESQDGPLQAPAAWMETVKDIDVLIEYYNTKSDIDAKNFGLVGGSMGGNISEYYIVYGKYKPTAICLENSSADLTNEGPAWDCFDKGRNGRPAIWTEEQLWSFTTDTAPINYPEYFKDIWMYICVGEIDNTHSPNKMEEFKNAVAALGSEKIVFHCFEGVGHETPQSWIDNERKEFFAKLRSHEDDPAPVVSDTENVAPPDPAASDSEAADTSPAMSDTKSDVTADITDNAAGDVQKPAGNDKNTPDTGAAGVTAVGGIAVIAAGAVFFSRKRK